MSKLKQKTNILILIIITLLVLFFALKDDFNEIINQLLTLNMWWLIVGIMLVLSFWFLRTLSIQVFIKSFNSKFKVQKAFRLILMTQFFNAITPFATGGQPFQIYYLKKDGIDISKGTSIVIQHFIVYQIALVILGFIAVLSNQIFDIFPKVGILKQLVTIGFIINVFVIIILFIVAFAKKLDKFIINLGIRFLSKLKIVKNKKLTLDNWDNYINNFHDGALVLMKNKKNFFGTIFLEFASLICLYLVPLAIFYSMDNYDVSPVICIISSAYVMLIGSFVPIPGGTGGLEYGFLAFFGNFVVGSTLKASMLVWRFITYYLGMILGAIAIYVKGKDD